MHIVGGISGTGVRHALARWWDGVTEGPPVLVRGDDRRWQRMPRRGATSTLPSGDVGEMLRRVLDSLHRPSASDATDAPGAPPGGPRTPMAGLASARASGSAPSPPQVTGPIRAVAAQHPRRAQPDPAAPSSRVQPAQPDPAAPSSRVQPAEPDPAAPSPGAQPAESFPGAPSPRPRPRPVVHLAERRRTGSPGRGRDAGYVPGARLPLIRRLRLRLRRQMPATATSLAAALVLAFAVGLWAGGSVLSEPAPPATPTTPKPVRIVRSVATTDKAVALTFDDGPSPTNTPAILQLLKQYGAHATFFVIGQEVERFPNLLKAEVDAGDEIGNHGYHHLTLRNVPEERLLAEVQSAEQTLVSLTGARPTLYRLPGGKSDPAALRALADLGYTIVMWSVDTRDYVYRAPSAIVAQVEKQLRPGSIVIFHDGGGSQRHTVQALRDLLPWLKAQGYQLLTVSQLMELPRRAVQPPQ